MMEVIQKTKLSAHSSVIYRKPSIVVDSLLGKFTARSLVGIYA